MDYTFNGVNQGSLPISPKHAMQFGTALQHFLQNLVYANPQFGPPLMAKTDLADGFYHIPVPLRQLSNSLWSSHLMAPQVPSLAYP
jgi:hypothetical protein